MILPALRVPDDHAAAADALRGRSQHPLRPGDFFGRGAEGRIHPRQRPANAVTVAQVRSRGLRTLSYTVNDDWAARRLIALGTDGIITDRVDLFAPAS